jgi:hypothetical protein
LNVKLYEIGLLQKKSKYHLITIQRPNESPKSIFLEGNISRFILIEKEFGRETVLLNVLEISEEEYDKATNLYRKG